MGSYVEHITTANSVAGKEGLMKHDGGVELG